LLPKPKPKQPSTINNNEYFDVFYVLECTPLLQGVLSKDSTIVLLNENNNHELSLARKLYHKLFAFKRPQVRTFLSFCGFFLFEGFNNDTRS
jgi:hypothetical protein